MAPPFFIRFSIITDLQSAIDNDRVYKVSGSLPGLRLETCGMLAFNEYVRSDMSYIEFNDEMVLNIKEIDAQHKKWIEIHNRLHDVLTTGNFKEAEKTAVETLKDMLEYSRTHFKFEEEYMHTIGYPGLIEHRRLHKNFDDRIYREYRQMLDGEIVLNSTIMKMIKSWLVGHIMQEDKKIARYLEKTVKTS
jgi:hemerythrin